MDELFRMIELEMPGYMSAAAGSIEAGGAFASHCAEGMDLAEARDALQRVVSDYHQLYEDLGGVIDVGSNDEVLMTASRAYVLVKMHHRKGRFVAVALSSSGNIGYLRFRMREYLRRVVEA